MKCRWSRTMLNFCGIVAANLKMATAINFSILGINWKFLAVAIFKMATRIQDCPISSRFDMWVDNDVPNWFPTLKNF
jgi:hypothetical protein